MVYFMGVSRECIWDDFSIVVYQEVKDVMGFVFVSVDYLGIDCYMIGIQVDCRDFFVGIEVF